MPLVLQKPTGKRENIAILAFHLLEITANNSNIHTWNGLFEEISSLLSLRLETKHKMCFENNQINHKNEAQDAKILNSHVLKANLFFNS